MAVSSGMFIDSTPPANIGTISVVPCYSFCDVLFQKQCQQRKSNAPHVYNKHGSNAIQFVVLPVFLYDVLSATRSHSVRPSVRPQIPHFPVLSDMSAQRRGYSFIIHVIYTCQGICNSDVIYFYIRITLL